MSITTLAARVLIALVVINAAAGVAALLISSEKQIGSFEGHIFLTTLAVSMAAFCALPCALASERDSLGRLIALAPLGMLAALLTLSLMTAAIWTDEQADNLDRAVATASCVSLGLALINLLSLAKLQSSQQWVRLAAYALTVLIAAEIIWALWVDEPSDDGLRVLAATAILLAASAILVPVLQRIGGPEVAPRGGLRYCPACGGALGADVGVAGACGVCGARFYVEFR